MWRPLAALTMRAVGRPTARGIVPATAAIYGQTALSGGAGWPQVGWESAPRRPHPSQLRAMLIPTGVMMEVMLLVMAEATVREI